MTQDLAHWTPRPRPERSVLEGRFVRLEPLDPVLHVDGLYDEITIADTAADQRFTWLFETPPVSRQALAAWTAKVATAPDAVFFAVIDVATGRIAGRQALMRIDQAFGVIEIGNIYWGPTIARKPAATEALYLTAAYAFDTLGYRRFEWKCNDLNEPSKRAALRFGFRHEGVFRQHMVVKGKNRDTAWFAMTDGDWQALRPAYQAWLSPANFDTEGRQRRRLEDYR